MYDNKKFEYGKSEIFLKNIELTDFYQEWLTDNNSKIFYNKNPVGKISKKINSIIYNKDLSLINRTN